MLRAAMAPASLIFHNARVWTLDRQGTVAEAVAVGKGRILAVGSNRDAAARVGDGAESVDCEGRTLMPGFVDAHCHLLATAGTLTGLDCGSGKVASIEDLKRLVRNAAAGGWVRGYGYDELKLAEGRHPNRWDLDEAAPVLPVRLDHRSGHAVALNSTALELAGINRDTVDPVEGVIERDEETGEPTGVLRDMGEFLRERLGASRDEGLREEGIGRLDRKLLSCGITSVQDAGPNNGLERWREFRRLKQEGRLNSRVTMMAGWRHLDEFREGGLDYTFGDDGLRLGHAKIMLTGTTGTLLPGEEDLGEMVAEAHRLGFPVAIHGVEREAVAAAARVLGERRWPGDRIEHCSECPPEVLRLVGRSGARVVTQPGFVYWNGDDYLARVEPELLPCLYPMRDWRDAGVPVSFGSDAPVIDLNPWPGIAAAVTGLTREGELLNGMGPDGEPKTLPLVAALRAYTLESAIAEGRGQCKGSIEPGKLADMVLLDRDLDDAAGPELSEMGTVLTVKGGEIVWQGGK